MSILPNPELSYPPAAAAALECASFLLQGSDERDDLLERLLENTSADSVEGWASVVRSWFQGTSHIYCAAFIAQAESEAEIDREVEAIASELASKS